MKFTPAQMFLLRALLSEDPNHWDLADAADEHDEIELVANLTDDDIDQVFGVLRAKIHKGIKEAKEMM